MASHLLKFSPTSTLVVTRESHPSLYGQGLFNPSAFLSQRLPLLLKSLVQVNNYLWVEMAFMGWGESTWDAARRGLVRQWNSFTLPE